MSDTTGRAGTPTAGGQEVAVVFDARCYGWSAGINSASFFTCRTCGSCIIEMDHLDTSRTLHERWHAATSTPAARGDES